jgi:16S rRNA (guanine527-N7)-methyltransferase
MGRRDGHSSRWTLEEALEESRSRGFLGPGPLEPQIEHARGFAGSQGRAPDSFLDLGCGGGLPGLVLVSMWPSAGAVLLDAMVRRAEFLEEACARLGTSDRVRVVCARAEDAARAPELRAQFDLVTARSFGPPAVTAECAVGFLRLGGRLVVSEPPEDSPQRWPESGLSALGLAMVAPATAAHRYAVIERSGGLDDRFPRRVGVPGKRPIWT